MEQAVEFEPDDIDLGKIDFDLDDLDLDIDDLDAGDITEPVSGIIAADSAYGPSWAMYRGDCCEVIQTIPDSSIDMSIHSPPFANLYIYSDSEADMGNCQTLDEFFEHYKFLIKEMNRVTVPGRLAVVHCKDLPKYANRDDTAGLIDFPGRIVEAYCGTEAAEIDTALRRIERRIYKAMKAGDGSRAARLQDSYSKLKLDLQDFPPEDDCGWSFHSRVTIWKCPVTERERTNNNGLLHKTATRDRSQLRQGMADYLLVFRKPPLGTLMSDKPVCGEERTAPTFEFPEGQLLRQGFIEPYIGDVSPRENNLHPSPFARKGNATDLSIDIWRRYAEPVWWDIDQTDVLNFKIARSDQDEKHICPLQLDLIRRAVSIWSNPDDVILSPFAGIGSEGYGSVIEGRRFVGIELKEGYFDVAQSNLKIADEKMAQKRLF